MDLSRPYADLIPGSRGSLLAALVQLEAPVSVRALARHAGASAQGALLIVNELSDSGLVFAERAGSALMVSLNRQHLAAEPLAALVGIRGRLIERLRKDVSEIPGAAGAWLFGSAARGDGGRSSDVDLLLVADRSIDDAGWIEATDRLRERVGLWTGNDVQLVEHTRSSFTRLVNSANPLVEALRGYGIPLTHGSRALLRTAA
ncbi:MAG TPA: nucleotidyltransferase domain-containing protein [Acidimicrobiales bacterium]|nr:nucleotidyltransferase domain-containing protein [Acidimicrobiales bacterium]